MSDTPENQVKLAYSNTSDPVSQDESERVLKKEISQHALYRSVLLISLLGITLSLSIFLAYAEATFTLSTRVSQTISSIFEEKSESLFSDYHYYYPPQQGNSINDEPVMFRCNQQTYTNKVHPGDNCTVIKAPKASYSHRDKFITPAFEEIR